MAPAMSKLGKVEVGGYVYVIGFENGLVKVGHTQDPRTRISSIKGAARTFGTTYVTDWVSPLHLDYRANEDALIAAMKSSGGTSGQREYFRGVSFQAAVEAAENLDYPEFDVNEEMTRAGNHGREFRTALIERASKAGPGGPLAQFFHTKEEIAEHQRQEAARPATASPTSVVGGLLKFLSPADLHDVLSLTLNELERRDVDILIHEDAIQTSWADVTKGSDNRFCSVYYDPKIEAQAEMSPVPPGAGAA